MGDLVDEALHEDRRLVRRLREGDEAAFDEFWRSHAERLHRFALSRCGGDADVARDAVQSALCKALEDLDSYRGSGSLFSWICGICRNELAGRSRVRTRRGPHLSLDAEPGAHSLLNALLSPNDTPEAALLRSEARTRVHETLDRLPHRHALALEWKYAAGLSVREIALRLELSEKAAESLLTRARLAFRDAFAATRDVDDEPVRSEDDPGGAAPRR
jgi:RNA polymerase sigma-70 factor (ECF subfamily)